MASTISGMLLQLVELLLELLQVRGVRLHDDHLDLGRLLRHRARDELEQGDDHKDMEDDRPVGPQMWSMIF